ncbi:DMT family transporter [Candidatus Acetothermia bacterium]|jgi:drug/metabolite transporter (DMT)-like permease|nr:DMT family transporter [Candidatus Acetothermia bacterium]MCI2427812.1 DMT family transporter [Candidatus Acetothermia bacterium]MCI2428330.1 DMT family transporter [Candidatus Acetothermia bacterium]
MAATVRKSLFFYGSIGVAIVAMSSAAIFIRLADAPVLTVAVWRMGIAALIIAPFVLRPGWWCGTRKREIRLSLFSGLFLSLHFLFWITSLQYTSVASSVVLVTTNPIFVGIGAHLFFREKTSRALLIGIVLAMAGAILIGWNGQRGGEDTLYGNFLALLGAVMASGYLLLGRRVRQSMPLINYIFILYGAATIILLSASLIMRQPLFGHNSMTYLYLLLLALIPQLLGHTTINWALRYLPASTVAVIILGEPVGATILAYFILSEGLTAMTAIGGAAVLTGIYP